MTSDKSSTLGVEKFHLKKKAKGSLGAELSRSGFEMDILTTFFYMPLIKTEKRIVSLKSVVLFFSMQKFSFAPTQTVL